MGRVALHRAHSLGDTETRPHARWKLDCRGAGNSFALAIGYLRNGVRNTLFNVPHETVHGNLDEHFHIIGTKARRFMRLPLGSHFLGYARSHMPGAPNPGADDDASRRNGNGPVSAPQEVHVHRDVFAGGYGWIRLENE